MSGERWAITVCARCRLPIEGETCIEGPYCMCADEDFTPDEADTAMVEVEPVAEAAGR